MFCRCFMPPELSAGKNFISLHPCSSACSMSLGVMIPGANGSPASAAASITRTLQPGLTPKSAPRLLASRAWSGVRIVPIPRVSGSPAEAMADAHSKARGVRSVISMAVTPPSQSALARSAESAGSFTASTATIRAFFSFCARFSIGIFLNVALKRFRIPAEPGKLELRDFRAQLLGGLFERIRGGLERADFVAGLGGGFA